MQEPFGKTLDGTGAGLFTLRNSNGLEARITNYGAILVSLLVPDRQGNFGDVVLGCDDLQGYLNEHPCFGATIGRYANRIATGRITLAEKIYQLTRNEQGNHLHGGLKDLIRWSGRRPSGKAPTGLRWISGM